MCRRSEAGRVLDVRKRLKEQNGARGLNSKDQEGEMELIIKSRKFDFCWRPTSSSERVSVRIKDFEVKRREIKDPQVESPCLF